MVPETTHDVTLGEVARRWEEVRDALTDLTSAVTTASTSQAAQVVRLEHLEAEVAELRAWQTWAMRLVVGAVLLAVVALVVRS